MSRLPTIAACVLLSTIVIVAAREGPAAQSPGSTIDPQTLGPKIGERVPDFTLPDQHGQTRTLRSMLGPNGAILVFFRSADW